VRSEGFVVAHRVADLSATVFPGSHADFGKSIADEIEKWGKVITSAPRLIRGGSMKS
jgi:hypothetical protein